MHNRILRGLIQISEGTRTLGLRLNFEDNANQNWKKSVPGSKNSRGWWWNRVVRSIHTCDTGNQFFLWSPDTDIFTLESSEIWWYDRGCSFDDVYLNSIPITILSKHPLIQKRAVSDDWGTSFDLIYNFLSLVNNSKRRLRRVSSPGLAKISKNITDENMSLRMHKMAFLEDPYFFSPPNDLKNIRANLIHHPPKIFVPLRLWFQITRTQIFFLFYSSSFVIFYWSSFVKKLY